MIKGIFFALAACFIWGLIFVVPQFMNGFGAIEIALGRYLVYGMISLFFLLRERLRGRSYYPISIWIKALKLSFASTMGYYIFVILALRHASPAICALILGISPITIAFYGNWKQKDCSFKLLILPSMLILLGLIIINVPFLINSTSISGYALGMLCSFSALISWSWYVVANSQFLKNHPEVQSGHWSTLLGVSALFWVGIGSFIAEVFFGNELQLDKYLIWDSALINFLSGCLILGLLCSWLGAFLWNRASLYLPVSLAGQLTIFETIFGLLFVYALDGRLPPFLEGIGILMFLAAIAYGIRTTSQTSPAHV